MACLIEEVAPALRNGHERDTAGALFVKADGGLYQGKNAMANLVQSGLKAAGIAAGATAKTARSATVVALMDAGLPHPDMEALARGMVRAS